MGKLIKRSQIVAFLNTTPSGEDKTWGLVGNGVTDLGYDYNSQENTETYVINDNATTTVDSYQLSLDTEMKCIKGDAIFDYINKLRYELAVGDDAVSDILLVDKYDFTGEGSTAIFKSQVFKCSISIVSYGGAGGETPTISFKVNANGDPTQGSCTISNGTPTFTPKA